MPPALTLTSHSIANETMAKKSWAEKMHTKDPRNVVLEKSFAGVAEGATLHISSPKAVATYLHEHTQRGQTQTIPQMRDQLAAQNGADATCPVSTAIFLRTVTEAAWDELAAGAEVDNIAPFWRVIEPGSVLAKKLRADSDWIASQRDLEAGD